MLSLRNIFCYKSSEKNWFYPSSSIFCCKSWIQMKKILKFLWTLIVNFSSEFVIMSLNKVHIAVYKKTRIAVSSCNRHLNTFWKNILGELKNCVKCIYSTSTRLENCHSYRRSHNPRHSFTRSLTKTNRSYYNIWLI
jgi:hypothetical protein